MSAAGATAATMRLSAIWERRREETMGAVAVVENAVRDGLNGQLDDAHREDASRAAHKLAGSAGTFGFLTAGEIAHELEHALSAPLAPPPDQCRRLADLVVALRRELEADSPPAPVAPAAATDLLVVGADHDRAQRLVDEAAARGLVAGVAASPATAHAIIERSRPRILLLDPVVSGGLDAALAFLSEMSPALPMLVLTDPAGDLDRVEVARRGGRGFLPRTLPVTELIDHVVGLRERVRADETKILAIDDDPTILDAIRAVLELDGLTVQTCETPGQLWGELERFVPDLLILDIELPGVSGLELCRAVRNDPRWSALPVLILTARREPSAVEAVFAAGADDYIAKPFSGRELTHRIANRLERIRLLRALADTDYLTGLANRRRATEAIETYQLLSRRSGQPLCLAVLDVDAFKGINSAVGHAGGDAALRGVARALSQHFRGEDIVSRWGGDEFVIGMFGMAIADARQRMDEFVEQVRTAALGTGEDRRTVTVSAGLAEFPTDGADVDSLYRAADEALYVAKAAGGDQARVAGRLADRPRILNVLRPEEMLPL